MSEIDVDTMEKLIALMVENDLSQLTYSQGELHIELQRGGQGPPALAAPGSATNPITAAAATPAADEPPAAADEHAGLVPITSPMVGTFYDAPDPDSPAFVTVGSTVQPDTTVCIIEAMKVFNEIKAETTGTIEKVPAKNAQAVEFGQALFYVKPS